MTELFFWLGIVAIPCAGIGLAVALVYVFGGEEMRKAILEDW